MPDHFSTAFQRLTQEIHEAKFTQGQAFTMSFLLSRFRSFLPETTDPSVYQNRTDKLEQRLKAYYGDKITIQNQRGQSKSSIVFSSSISVGESVKAASNIKASASDLSNLFQDRYDNEGLDESNANDNESITLYHAASILKSAIKRSKNKDRPPGSLGITTKDAEDIIPDELYMFMRLLIEGDVGFQPLNLPREHSKQSNVHRLILSLAQDNMYACGKSIVTPKHMGLAVTMKHITGSKDVTTILNRFGHCVSYEEVIRFDTMCTNKQLHDSEHTGVIVPSNILPGSFIQAAADN